MREATSQRAQTMDVRDQTELGQLNGTVQAAMKEAATWRGHVVLAVTEQQRRELLAEKHPAFHQAEATARKLAAAAKQRQQAQAPARVEAPAATVTPQQ
ncbi:hypothetical protein [Streptomyces exfoliatus]|uniref:hypothetical protein n=1 Tax=Streptomyces exfoliatus TaxID=1905 RepID=UPI003C2C6EE2